MFYGCEFGFWIPAFAGMTSSGFRFVGLTSGGFRFAGMTSGGFRFAGMTSSGLRFAGMTSWALVEGPAFGVVRVEGGGLAAGSGLE